MTKTIGLLLPRSSEYPSMGFDILSGLKSGLALHSDKTFRYVTDNIGFGENATHNYACAEKMILQEEASVIICYSHFLNAEPLYTLASSSGKTFIFLDAGMQMMTVPQHEHCFHISLQGVHACSIAGARAAEGNKNVLIATSFYDGGYRGPWGCHQSIVNAGGKVCGNYVSGYKTAEFSIEKYLDLLQHSGAEGVAACFSTYLAVLFFGALKEAGAPATALPFYCSPFMAEEELMKKCVFPGGTFHAVVPWHSSIKNSKQQLFASVMKNDQDKGPNLFSLLGWEAALLLSQLLTNGSGSLKGWTFESPRGEVAIHPQTHHTYAPLYYGRIVEDDNGKCAWQYHETIPVDPATHIRYLIAEKNFVASGWKNNYFCI